MNYQRFFFIILFFLVPFWATLNGQSIFYPQSKQVFTLDSLGACQGVCVIEGKLYLYGDRKTGVIREYRYTGDKMEYLGGECQLTFDGKEIINHPTGIAFHNGEAFIGNSIRNPENPQKWIATIYRVAWNKFLQYRTLD